MGLRSLSKVVAALSLLTIAAGCASQETVQALREPSLPPVAVLKAEQGGKLYRNISIQEIEGAPEFRWFDGGAVLTTRPTRSQVQDRLTVLLDRADLTAPSRLDSTYMLYVKFDDLHGPDMWVGSDKLATARIHFRLVEWRTGKLVKVDIDPSIGQGQAVGDPLHLQAVAGNPVAIDGQGHGRLRGVVSVSCVSGLGGLGQWPSRRTAIGFQAGVR